MELSILELADWIGAEPWGRAPRKGRVTICIDSKRFKKGQVFWAIKGEKFDGHNFVESCLSQGGSTAVVNKSWNFNPEKIIGTLLKVEDTKQSLLDLANAYLDTFKIPKIAITGSNGKTTTKDMIVSVLSRAGSTLGTQGNFNNHIGLPLTAFQMKSSHRYSVFEMGTNHPGEIEVLSQAVRPNIAVITNIGYSHIEFFGTTENIFKEKLSISSGFKARGVLVVNVDDSHLAKVRPGSRYKLITYGINRGQIRATNIRLDQNGCASFTVGRTEFRLNIPGEHNIYNALAAIAVGIQMRINRGDIAKALASFKPSPHRMQIKKISGITFLDDCYNANPSSMKASLRTLSMTISSGKKIALLGDMLELGDQSETLHSEVGQYFSEMGIDELITFGTASRFINKGAREKGTQRNLSQHFTNMNLLGEYLKKNLQKGDTVLVKGSRGMQLERVYDFLINIEKAPKEIAVG